MATMQFPKNPIKPSITVELPGPTGEPSALPPGVRRDIAVQTFVKEGKPFPAEIHPELDTETPVVSVEEFSQRLSTAMLDAA